MLRDADRNAEPRLGVSKSRNAAVPPTARAIWRIVAAARGSRLPCAASTTSGGMQTALGLVEHGPPAGPRVLAGTGPPGARPAADAAVPVLDQRVHRDVEALDVGVDLGLSPVGQRGDLDLSATHFIADVLSAGARRALVPAQAGGPGVVRPKRLLQRSDFAQRAALVRVGGEQPGTVLPVLLAHGQLGLGGDHVHRQR